MEINIDYIVKIIENNKKENLVCMVLEMRPGMLAKCVSGLANVAGGYIMIGAEVSDGKICIKGFLKAFNMGEIMENVKHMLSEDPLESYGNVRIGSKNVFVIKVGKTKQKVSSDGKYYLYTDNSIEIVEDSKRFENPKLFISYRECDAPIVDLLEGVIRDKMDNEIEISRYTQITYKESFKQFMNSIQAHDFVLSVVSDSYLRSQACMYEVGETIKDHHYREKLLFVVLGENERKYYGENAPKKIAANIYGGPLARLEYVNYWKNQYKCLEKMIKEIDDYEATRNAANDLKEIGQIYRNDVGEFLDFLSDENGRSFAMLAENDFEDIVNWIRK
ncbi:hypothetical protein SH1V18_38310 [Vallitalea longa]|uniref:TIR domain-containing protein n=1 Tax=Vallitalea longa TaxID=2936439 RepID=A0A9W6DFL2_9FIRM|nr:TIR domain-containing protein [Vallitalea longa]GKX31351.1 hypothetical protein SH1V18_38310 [Vallitalea longa]